MAAEKAVIERSRRHSRVIFRSLEQKKRLNLGANKMTFLRNIWNDEQGQDLIEYTLLMAFVALASAALFLGAGGSIKGIWTVTNTQLANANTSAS
jgi:Flp pilus assembly pilin Flp